MALTKEIVLQLRALREAGLLDVKAAAEAHGVARETIRRALRGETFLAVPQPRTAAELDQEAAASEQRMLAMMEQQRQKTEALVAGAQDIPPPNPLEERAAVPQAIEDKARQLLGDTHD